METPLRPLSLSELLDRTFFLYRKHFVLFVGITAIPFLILLPIQIVFTEIRMPSDMGSPPDIMMRNAVLTLALGLLLGILVGVAGLIAQAASIIAVSKIHLGNPASIGDSYAGIKGSFVNLLFAVILVTLGCTGGFILCIVPGIIFSVAWILSIPVVLIEIKGPIGAMKRSWELTKGRRWQIFLILFLVGIFTYIVTGILQVPVIIWLIIKGLNGLQNIPPWVNVISQIGSFISSCLVIPVSTISTSLIYYDQRVRKEGFDLQILMSSLESHNNADAAPTAL
jgi:hypothetical protein